MAEQSPISKFSKENEKDGSLFLQQQISYTYKNPISNGN